jgi:hypothetical protein
MSDEPTERSKDAELEKNMDMDVINLYDIYIMRNIIMKSVNEGVLQGEERLYAELMRKKLDRQLRGKEHLFEGK